jgi:hypothetical protein
MKQRPFCLAWGIFTLTCGVGLLLVAVEICSTQKARAEEQQEGREKPPPLVVDTSDPLLLEGAPKEAEVGGLAENQACHVCHENYRDEPLVQVHAEAEVGCVECHGDSFAHRNDENHTTPPDVMFSAAKIDSGCAECHVEHDAPARKVIARMQERCPEKTDPSTINCTDCHGKHRLERRTVVWDKDTGKLLSTK